MPLNKETTSKQLHLNVPVEFFINTFDNFNFSFERCIPFLLGSF